MFAALDFLQFLMFVLATIDVLRALMSTFIDVLRILMITVFDIWQLLVVPFFDVCWLQFHLLVEKHQKPQTSKTAEYQKP